MEQADKPTPIDSVDPTFGMSEAEAAAAKQAAKQRHPAFNPGVYRQLVDKALEAGDDTTAAADETVDGEPSAQRLRYIHPALNYMGGRKIEPVEIDDSDGESLL